MRRFWNLQTKFVLVLVLVLVGCLLAQGYVDLLGRERLYKEVVEVADDLAGQVADKMAPPLALASSVEAGRPTVFFLTIPKGCYGVRVGTRPQKIFISRNDANILLEVRRCIAQMRRESVARGVEPPFQLEMMDELLGRAVAQQIPGASAPAPGGNYPDPEMTFSKSGFATHTPLPTKPEEIDLSPYTSRLQRIFEEHRRDNHLATAGIFLLGIGLAWFLGLRMTRPVYQVVDGFRKVAEGDLEAQVPGDQGGEIGLLGRQFNEMVARLRENRKLERELALRERLQHMGNLAAGVAHEVRNPLNSIHLNISQIRDEFIPSEGKSRDRFVRFTSDVQKEVERLNQLVTNFLSLAKPSAGERELIDPNSVVQDLMRLIRKEAAAHDIEIELRLMEGFPHLRWDPQEMKSALLNIAMNALQAMESDGGKLRVSTLVDKAANGESEAVIRFSDTGPGISPDDFEKVFIPYFTTRRGGTGLGMAIARRVVERHGGSVLLESRVGDGTTVSFVFPLSAKGENVA